MVFTRSSSSSSSSSQSFIYLRLRPSVFLTRIHPRLFHSRDLPFRVSFASQPKRGKKASRCLRRTPPYPPLRGLIPRITTLSDAEKKRRRGRKGRGGGRGEEGARVDFVFRSNFCKGEIYPSLSPGIGEKAKRRTSARNETYPRDIESRYRSRLPRREIPRLFGTPPPSPPPPSPRCISMHFEGTRLHATISFFSSFSSPPPLTYSISSAIPDTNRVAYLYGGARDQ